MMKTYVRAVVVLMALLMVTRARDAVLLGGMDGRTILFTLVEAGFFAWGLLILFKQRGKTS